MQTKETKNLTNLFTDLSIAYSPRIEVQPLQPFSIAAFKGGGQKAIVYAGMQKYFEEQGLITPDIQMFVGTSAGGLTAALLGLGYGSEDIKNLFATEFSDMLGVHTLAEAAAMGVKGIPALFKQYGLITPDNIIPTLDQKIKAVLGKENATFKDLDDYIKAHPESNLRHFAVVGAEVSTGHTKVFSFNTTPNMPISKAMYITMACQPIFAPLEYEGKLYGDGGISANNPLEITRNIAKEKNIPEECIINIRTDSGLDKAILSGEGSSEKYKKDLSINNLVDYLKKLIQNVQNQDHDVLNINQTLIISNLDCQTFEVPLTSEKVNRLFNEGYEEAKQWHTNFRKDAVSSIKEYPSIYSRVKAIKKEDVKERANALALAIEELGKYKASLPESLPIQYLSKFDKTNLNENQIVIFQNEQGKWKFAIKDLHGNIFEQNLEKVEKLDLNKLNIERLDEISPIIFDHYKNLIGTRMQDMSRELVLIQEVHKYFPKAIISQQKPLIEETRKNIDKKRSEALHLKEEDLKIKLKLWDVTIQTLEKGIVAQEIPSIEKATQKTKEEIENTEQSLKFLSNQMRQIKKELRGGARGIEYQIELIQRKNEALNELLLYYDNGLKNSSDTPFLFLETLEEVQKLIQENQSFFSESELKELNANLEVLRQPGVTEEILNQQQTKIENLLNQSKQTHSNLHQHLTEIENQLDRANKPYYLCERKMKQVEMLKEAIPLRKDLNRLLENINQLLFEEGKFITKIDDFLCKIFHVKDNNLPQDVSSFRQAKLFKDLVENLIYQLDKEGISTATVDDLINTFNEVAKEVTKEQEEKLKGITTFFSKNPLLNCKKEVSSLENEFIKTPKLIETEV